MSWAIGYDTNWNRDIGYGVPAVCDYPRCNTQINRGLDYVCGGEPYGGEWGCGLYFCSKHSQYVDIPERDDETVHVCERCAHNILIGDHPKHYLAPFDPKPDTREWIRWKLTDASWQGWREDNPEKVTDMRRRLGKDRGKYVGNFTTQHYWTNKSTQDLISKLPVVKPRNKKRG